jgi:hypothetical protein
MGDEAQVFGAGRFDGPGEPVRVVGQCADRSQIDFLIPKAQGGSVRRSKGLTPHAENPLVPRGGGFNVSAIQHNMVEPFYSDCHL